MDRLVWATSATARPRSRCAPRSRRSRTGSRSRCWCRPPSSRSSTQHVRAQRFAAFPVRVAHARRFVPPKKEQERDRRRPRGRQVDVVIGTHRILLEGRRTSRDLGLLVVDEEQRFGVAHKERLKQMRTRGRRPDAVRDADPAHAAPGARRDPRHVASSRRRRRTGCRSRRASPRTTTGSCATRSRASSTAAARSSSSTTGSRRSRPRPSACGASCPARASRSATARWPRAMLERVMLDFDDGELRRPRLHHDHRVGPRHPERQHDHHRPRRHVRPGPALPAARPRRPLRSRRAYATCSTAAGSGSHRRRAQAARRRSSAPPSWAPASRSRSRTSRSAAPATSSAPSSTASWRRSASRCTPGCSRRRSTSCAAAGRRRSASPVRLDLPGPPTCPTTTSPTPAPSWRRTAGSRTCAPRRTRMHCARSCGTGTGRSRPPSRDCSPRSGCGWRPRPRACRRCASEERRVTLKWARMPDRREVGVALQVAGLRPDTASNQVRVPVGSGTGPDRGGAASARGAAGQRLKTARTSGWNR